MTARRLATATVMLMLSVVLLRGTGDAADQATLEARLAKLEARVAELESQAATPVLAMPGQAVPNGLAPRVILPQTLTPDGRAGSFLID